MNPTLGYIAKLLAITSALEKGDKLPKFLEKMSDKDLKKLVETLLKCADSHYRKNLSSVINSVRKAQGPTGFYYVGNPVTWEKGKPPDILLRKCALYYDKILLKDNLLSLLQVYRYYENPSPLVRVDLPQQILTLLMLVPWIKAGFVELTSHPISWEGVGEATDKALDEDTKDTAGWHKEALRDEDEGLEGEALIHHWKEMLSESLAEKPEESTLRELAVSQLTGGASLTAGTAVIGSAITGCCPLTQLRHEWRLLGLWASRRAIKLAQSGDLKVGQALTSISLDTRLSFLSSLPPDEILDIRKSREFSFFRFRGALKETFDALRYMPWDINFEKDAQRIWQEKVQIHVEDVRRDLQTVSRISKATRVTQGFTFAIGILTGLSFATIALSLLAAQGSSHIVRLMRERELEKNSMAFLVKVESEAERNANKGVWAHLFDQK